MTDTETQQFLNRAPLNREQQYQEQFAALDAAQKTGDYDSEVAVTDDLDASVLSVERTHGFTITISTGGPGEWLEVTCDPDEITAVESVTFCTAWWSPVQRSTVNEGDALWRLAEYFAESVA